ncbi:protein IMPACT isoform X2 [Polypterus senegalus]|uniref:protein IMPACT isoform X2 n=1 Tax=Polypterus senegalus TaxID=55291 RepID=UPI001963A4B9|nr:protein IMPACT isoform X2 [Polypterus senegalus]
MSADSAVRDDNLQCQIDEIEALSSIYGEEWCTIDEAARVFCIKVSDGIDKPKWTLCLQVILPPDYPGVSPPIYQLNSPWLRGAERMELSNSLEEIYAQNLGESILYMWVERIREFLVEKSQNTDSENLEPDQRTAEISEDAEEDIADGFHVLGPIQPLILSDELEDEEELLIKHGEPFTDRRSTFQAHLAPVVTTKQVKLVLNKLYENKKIANATHNIYAYRIYCEDKQTFLQDCEDDGETAAGGRLLHLLQAFNTFQKNLGQRQIRASNEILDVRNVMVIVSRWFGGILLGPDRFKHINNCARNILMDECYIDPVDDSAKSADKKKKQRGRRGK